ncbi:TetR/AcrR family transcriptional regulator [Sphingomonas sp. CD22]|uniref:TetR/AcrR family transcriptional regulator n=1 Tax=Sphingomonas sp. CD22 TaxID=3100214 RepID=UPI002ADF0F9C|nr:TetR/AcrR family transcriptional regulator [Sphingomonas sp. CD22]MEA1085168.1 TetR/AcrR family transcriptional regulator [Sphingomonas sp. CD22]
MRDEGGVDAAINGQVSQAWTPTLASPVAIADGLEYVGKMTPAKDIATPRPNKARRTRAPARTQTERREATIEVILDEAETLFAYHGRDGVTIKAIASAAGVTPALINYYFDGLENIFEAVWSRRASVLNPIRIRVLNEYEATNAGKLEAAGAIDAFLRPIFDHVFTLGDGWSNFMSLIGMTNTTRFCGAFYMDKHFDDVVQRFLEIMRRIGNVPDDELFWFTHHLLGSLTFSMAQTGRIDRISKGKCSSADYENVLRSSVQLFSSAYIALKNKYEVSEVK